MSLAISNFFDLEPSLDQAPISLQNIAITISVSMAFMSTS